MHSPIQVSLRLKPLDSISPDPPILSIDPQFPNTLLLSTGSDVPKPFTFDHIFSETCSQSTIFSTIAKPLLLSCLEGYNVCIFAYGQTGAGKTYTILGPDNMQEKGLVPRSIDELFGILSNNYNYNNKQTVIKASFLEIYNEQIIDLLDNSKKNLSLREDLRKGVYVEGLSEETISDSFEAQELLRKGSRIRHIGATSMNIESSRSHSVFTLYFETKKKLENGVLNIKSSKLSFVDLAGSERQKNVTLISGERLKEGCNINRSLHVLGNVINALVEVTDGKTRHIHYRDSKLTFLLKDSLGGNSKTSLIANVNQGSHYFQETFSTIKFAKRVKMIKNSVFINEDITGSSEGLRQEIRRLKQEILSLQYQKGNSLNTVKINHEKISDFTNSERKNENIDGLLKKFVENSYEVETLLQEELANTRQEKAKLHEFIKEFHGLEENYRLIISLQRERLKRNGVNFDDLLMKENEELRDLLKHMPYLVKLFEENLLLKTEPAPFNETRINNDVLIQSLQQNISELKELKTFLQENTQLDKNRSINLKENPNICQNSENLIESNLLLNENNNITSQNNEIPSTINEIEAISPIKMPSTHTYNEQNMVSKELFDEMQLKYTEKIELLNLELIENRPNNGFLQQKLIENQDSLEIAYEKIANLEAELDDYRAKIKELATLTENKCQELVEKPANECVFQEKILEKELYISQLQEANGFLKEDLASAKEEILHLNEKIGCFEAQEKEKDNEIRSKNQEIEEIRCKLNEKESVVQIKDENIGKLKEKIKEVEESNKQINEIQEELNQKTREMREINEKYSKMEAILNEKDAIIKEITVKNEELTHSFHENQQKLLEDQTILNENFIKIKKMEEEITQLEEQNHQEKNEISQNIRDLKDSKQKINEQEILIDVLQKSLREKDLLINESNAQLQENTASLFETNRLLEIKTKDFTEKSQSNQQLMGSLAEKNQQLNEMERYLQEKAETNLKLSQEIEQKTLKIQELEQIYCEFLTKHQETLNEIEAKSQTIQTQALQIDEKEQLISEITTKFNEKTKRLELLSNELQENSQTITSQISLLKEKDQLIKEISQALSQKTASFNEKDLLHKENQGELTSLQEYMRSLEKSHEDLQKKSSSLAMELGLANEKFDALQAAHETLQTRYDNLEKSSTKKQEKLQKDLEIKANNSQELVKRIEILSKENENKANLCTELTKKLEIISQESEKIKRKHEKHIEELEIKHSETIKTLYDERKEQLEEMLREKEEAAEGEIEQYKRLIANLKKQNENLEKELDNKEDLQKKSSTRLFKDNDRLKDEIKLLIKEKEKILKEYNERNETTQKNNQLIRDLEEEKENLERKLKEKEQIIKEFQGKNENISKVQAKDMENFKKEYEKIKNENSKLKEDLLIESGKIKKIIQKNEKSSEEFEFLRTELEKKTCLVKSFNEGMSKLTQIININGLQRILMVNGQNNNFKGGVQELESLIQGVKYLIASSLDKENKIKEKERELDSRNLKYSIMEREYLLQKQKLHVLQQNERRKEKERMDSLEKKAIQGKDQEIIEKITLRERANSMHRTNSNPSNLVGTIIKKH